MPRKDKKSKKPKKPKVKGPRPTLRPAKLKPCLDCGYKTGSAFTIPFGYADRLGTRRAEIAPAAPVVNINLAKPEASLLGDYFKKPVAKTEMSIQTDDPLAYVKLPTRKKAASDFEMENIYKQKPEDIFLNPYDVYNEPFVSGNKGLVMPKPDMPIAVAEPFQFPSPCAVCKNNWIIPAGSQQCH